MKDLIIKIERKTSQVFLSKKTLGINGENLQGNLVFEFTDGFVDGMAFLELETSQTSGFLPLIKEEKCYKLPIMSSLLANKGNLTMQLRITENENADGIPVFKSNIFYLEVKEAINSEKNIVEEYPNWVDVVNAKINIIKTDGRGNRYLSDDGTYKYVEGGGSNGGGGDIDLSNYATKDEIPTKTSELTNDSNYLTSIPSEYITETELNAKGYLTSIPSTYKTKTENDTLYQPIGDYATTSAIPTKVSQLTNDRGYITGYTESDPTVPAHVKAITQNDISKWNEGGSGLTTEQINALNEMFKVCAYVKEDVNTEYNTFKTAFGIDGESGETEPTKTLQSISATYTGGNVEVGTNVNSLTGITVKANYSDGTSTNVTGYTLSGTIKEGSNIITVTYQGLTTTFAVIGVAEETGGGETTKTLQSISATYTGGNVTVGTSVNSLTGVTVKANYSDGSQENVTDYTLSGNIVEGNNTITVSYEGLTTTFIVVGVAESTGGEETNVSNETTWTDGVAYTYTAVDGSYVETSGKLTDYASWSRTPYLYCKGASKLRVKVLEPSAQYNGGNGGYNCFYDEDKNFIQSFSFGGLSATEAGSTVDINIPANATYLICSGKANVISATNPNVNNDFGKPYLEFIPYA